VIIIDRFRRIKVLGDKQMIKLTIKFYLKVSD